jgi:hypothetical protein
MLYSEPARTTMRRIPGTLVAGLVVVVAAIAAALGYPVLASSSSTAASPIGAFRPEAVDHGCPPVYADPTHDPRMRGEK